MNPLPGRGLRRWCLALAVAVLAPAALAQVPPSAAEVAAYRGLLAKAHRGDVPGLEQAIAAGAPLNVRDSHGRTALHIATFARQQGVIRALARAGADLNLLENDRYDAVTIAAVADDEDTLRLLLSLGAKAGQVTSRYDGTALIAAAHLGDGGPRHQATLKALMDAGASLRLTDRHGQTPLQLARAWGYPEMVQMLERAAP